MRVDGRTPLQYAAAMGIIPAIKVLLELNADVNLQVWSAIVMASQISVTIVA